jgi:hypothetical protein
MIVGSLDLSLRGTGMCLIYTDTWNCDLANIKLRTYGEKLDKTATPFQHVLRRQRIAHAVSDFFQCRPDAIFHEGILTHGAYGIVGLASLLGVVEMHLSIHSLVTTPVALTSARKTALGRVPRGTPKAEWQKPIAALRKWGSHDEIDAFLVANHAIKTMGLPYWTLQ